MRINALITEQPVKIEGLQDILSKLNIGDVVRAKVLEMTTGELVLRLFDGTVLKAATSSEINTSPGENIELTVKGKIDGKLIMETVKADNNVKTDAPQIELKQILQNIDVKPEHKNMQLAAEIKTAGLEVTRQLFDKASEMLDKFISLSTDKAVFLTAKNIKPEAGNINNLVKIVEGTLKIGNQLDELINLISSYESAKVTETSQKSKTGSENNVTTNTDLVETNKENTKISIKVTLSETKQPDMPQTEKQPQQQNQVKSNSKIVENTISTTSNMPEKIDNSQVKIDELPGSSKLQLPEDKEIPSNTFKINSKIGEIIEKDRTLLLKNDQTFEKIQKDNDSLSKLKHTFDSIFVKTDSDDLKSELNVKQLYKDILDKLDSMKSNIQSLGSAEKAEITTRLNNIDDGIRLLGQISNNNAYFQIPLNIAGYNTTGELYVMKKEQGKKRIDPRNAMMLIALDTQNIGHIETLIDVKDKNVSINLRADSQKVMDFLKENYRYLYSSLMDKGFRLVDIRYRVTDEKVNMISAERTAREVFAEGRKSVDLKI